MPDRLWNRGRTRKPYRPKRRAVGSPTPLTLWLTRCVLAGMLVFMVWAGSRFAPIREYLQYVFIPGAALESPWARWLDWQPTNDAVQPVWVAITGRQDTMYYELPVEGAEVSQAFGWTNRATYNEGIYLRGAVGSPVTAVLSGKVVVVDITRGEIIIDHGSELRTIYRDCAAVSVKPGDRVKAKQVIARVAEGELFFGLTQAGKPLDPLLKVRSQGAR